ncbi:uncharacterized protein [Chelonus insularis]|uniref:uncharacterized protein n=1 Tax=Chelonus insularis TaxID=460826 RepID=UPI00158D2623|nr:uncharacterized protein LOC118073389 [Chelonus insularis]
MTNSTYKIKLNLLEISALRIAQTFWNRKEVKNKIVEFFNSGSHYDNYDDIAEWRKLTKVLIDTWDDVILPIYLKIELTHIIREIGEKIYDRYWYIKNENKYQVYTQLKEIINYVAQIRWTPFGTVDETETYKAFLSNNPDISATLMYCFACKFVVEECVNKLWDHRPTDVQNGTNQIRIHKNDDDIMVAYFKYLDDKDYVNFIKYFVTTTNPDMFHMFLSPVYNLNHTTTENMMRLSIDNGNYTAMRYFWEKLSLTEKKRNIVHGICSSVMHYNYLDSMSECQYPHDKERYIQIFLFFINQISVDLRRKVLNDTPLFIKFDVYTKTQINVKYTVLKMLLFKWPWQQLLIPALKEMIKDIGLDSVTVRLILDKVTARMVEFYDLGYEMRNSTHQLILHEIWSIIPDRFKVTLTKNCRQTMDFMRNLVYVWDLDSLRMILNDPKVQICRNEYIEAAKEGYLLLMIRDEFELLDEFMLRFLRSEEEKRWFKQKIYFWDSIRRNSSYQFVRELNMNSSTIFGPTEERFLQECTSCTNLCSVFLRMNRLDLAYKFLQWTYNSRDDRSCYKTHVTKFKILSKWVYEVWMTRTRR